MNKDILSTVIVASRLSLGSLILPLLGDLRAAEPFAKVTTGPGGDRGISMAAAWGDYSNDGFIDLFVAQSGSADGTASAFQFLYLNNTDSTFTRITNGPIGSVKSAGGGAAWGDYDIDG